MVIKRPDDVKSSEITPKGLVLARRAFLRGAALVGSVAATGLLYKTLLAPARKTRQSAALPADEVAAVQPPRPTDQKLNSYEDITTYNNYYEFSTDKYGASEAAAGFVSRPWTVAIDGLCANPKVWDLDALLRRFPLEERVYRLRCVEGWSMVIPWMGFSLSRLLADAQPLGSAKFVAFQTLLDPKRMPNQNGDVLSWPYVEGLRLDEAVHPLATLVGGLYGETLPPQNGAPLRLVVPWKYGFKGVKAIVKISLVERQPPTTWNSYSGDEYGFYSNVNPNVPHPRWSQATERRLGEVGKRDTILFNGYGDQVASLYAGMDLKKNF